MICHDFSYCEPSIDLESGVTQRSDIRGYFLSRLWWSKILWWCCFFFKPPESKFSWGCDTSAHLFILQETESGEGINKMLLATVLSEMRINWRWPLNHEGSSRAKMVYGTCLPFQDSMTSLWRNLVSCGCIQRDSNCNSCYREPCRRL
jgi:hypothetical protein